MENKGISITKLNAAPGNQQLFSIDFFGDHILTTVTSTPSVVRKWIGTTWYLHRLHRHHFVVGLGVQWNPSTSDSDPAATLQLCVGSRCLILQLTHIDSIPNVVRRFLDDHNTTFVGIWNHSDRNRLMRSEHELSLSSDPLDVRYSVAERFDEPDLVQASMETLVNRFFGYDGVIKDREVSRSEWDAYWLTNEQVLYASIDAYVSFRMGKDMRLGSTPSSPASSSSSSY